MKQRYREEPEKEDRSARPANRSAGGPTLPPARAEKEGPARPEIAADAGPGLALVPAEVDLMLHGPAGLLGRGSRPYQVARLADDRLDSPLRRFMAGQIDAVQGNLHLAEVLEAVAAGKRDQALAVSSPQDPQEQEAEQVAKAVTEPPEADAPPPVAAKEVRPARSLALQTGGPNRSRPRLNPELAERIRGLSGRGRPLPAETRATFEQRFGRDFSQVRLHTDRQSQETAGDLQARAFTTGPDIAFGRGQYRPGTAAGQHLLAHELTHVVQQGTSSPLPDQLPSPPARPETPAPGPDPTSQPHPAPQPPGDRAGQEQPVAETARPDLESSLADWPAEESLLQTGETGPEEELPAGPTPEAGELPEREDGRLGPMLEELAGLPPAALGRAIDRLEAAVPQILAQEQATIDQTVPPEIMVPLGWPAQAETIGDEAQPPPAELIGMVTEQIEAELDPLPSPQEADADRLKPDPQAETTRYRQQSQAGQAAVGQQRQANRSASPEAAPSRLPADAGPRPAMNLTRADTRQRLEQQQATAEAQISGRLVQAGAIAEAGYAQDSLWPAGPVETHPLADRPRPVEPPPALEKLSKWADGATQQTDPSQTNPGRPEAGQPDGQAGLERQEALLRAEAVQLRQEFKQKGLARQQLAGQQEIQRVKAGEIAHQKQTQHQARRHLAAEASGLRQKQRRLEEAAVPPDQVPDQTADWQQLNREKAEALARQKQEQATARQTTQARQQQEQVELNRAAQAQAAQSQVMQQARAQVEAARQEWTARQHDTWQPDQSRMGEEPVEKSEPASGSPEQVRLPDQAGLARLHREAQTEQAQLRRRLASERAKQAAEARQLANEERQAAPAEPGPAPPPAGGSGNQPPAGAGAPERPAGPDQAAPPPADPAPQAPLAIRKAAHQAGGLQLSQQELVPTEKQVELQQLQTELELERLALKEQQEQQSETQLKARQAVQTKQLARLEETWASILPPGQAGTSEGGQGSRPERSRGPGGGALSAEDAERERQRDVWRNELVAQGIDPASPEGRNYLDRQEAAAQAGPAAAGAMAAQYEAQQDQQQANLEAAQAQLVEQETEAQATQAAIQAEALDQIEAGIGPAARAEGAALAEEAGAQTAEIAQTTGQMVEEKLAETEEKVKQTLEAAEQEAAETMAEAEAEAAAVKEAAAESEEETDEDGDGGGDSGGSSSAEAEAEQIIEDGEEKAAQQISQGQAQAADYLSGAETGAENLADQAGADQTVVAEETEFALDELSQQTADEIEGVLDTAQAAVDAAAVTEPALDPPPAAQSGSEPDLWPDGPAIEAVAGSGPDMGSAPAGEAMTPADPSTLPDEPPAHQPGTGGAAAGSLPETPPEQTSAQALVAGPDGQGEREALIESAWPDHQTELAAPGARPRPHLPVILKEGPADPIAQVQARIEVAMTRFDHSMRPAVQASVILDAIQQSDTFQTGDSTVPPADGWSSRYSAGRSDPASMNQEQVRLVAEALESSAGVSEPVRREVVRQAAGFDLEQTRQSLNQIIAYPEFQHISPGQQADVLLNNLQQAPGFENLPPVEQALAMVEVVNQMPADLAGLNFTVAMKALHHLEGETMSQLVGPLVNKADPANLVTAQQDLTRLVEMHRVLAPALLSQFTGSTLTGNDFEWTFQNFTAEQVTDYLTDLNSQLDRGLAQVDILVNTAKTGVDPTGRPVDWEELNGPPGFMQQTSLPVQQALVDSLTIFGVNQATTADGTMLRGLKDSLIQNEAPPDEFGALAASFQTMMGGLLQGRDGQVAPASEAVEALEGLPPAPRLDSAKFNSLIAQDPTFKELPANLQADTLTSILRADPEFTTLPPVEQALAMVTLVDRIDLSPEVRAVMATDLLHNLEKQVMAQMVEEVVGQIAAQDEATLIKTLPGYRDELQQLTDIHQKVAETFASQAAWVTPQARDELLGELAGKVDFGLAEIDGLIETISTWQGNLPEDEKLQAFVEGRHPYHLPAGVSGHLINALGTFGWDEGILSTLSNEALLNKDLITPDQLADLAASLQSGSLASVGWVGAPASLSEIVLQAAWQTAYGIPKGLLEGGWEAVAGMGSMGWDLFKMINPAYMLYNFRGEGGTLETWQNYGEIGRMLFSDPLGMGEQMLKATLDPIIQDWEQGNYGEAIGRVLFEVLTSIELGGAATTGELGTVVSLLSRVEEILPQEVISLIKEAESLEEITDVLKTLSPENAKIVIDSLEKIPASLVEPLLFKLDTFEDAGAIIRKVDRLSADQVGEFLSKITEEIRPLDSVSLLTAIERLPGDQISNYLSKLDNLPADQLYMFMSKVDTLSPENALTVLSRVEALSSPLSVEAFLAKVDTLSPDHLLLLSSKTEKFSNANLTTILAKVDDLTAQELIGLFPKTPDLEPLTFIEALSRVDQFAPGEAEEVMKWGLRSLHRNLNTLEERRAKFGLDQPMGLLNQIEDYEDAVELAELVIEGESSAKDFLKGIPNLNLSPPPNNLIYYQSLETVDDFKSLFLKLIGNRCILEEKLVKFGSREPLGLLNQIEDYEYAMELTELAIKSEISKEEFLEEIKKLILDPSSTSNTSILDMPLETADDFKPLFLKLTKNLCILEERRAKFGLREPIGLLNQIEDYEYAMELTELAIRSEISKEEFFRKIPNLNLNTPSNNLIYYRALETEDDFKSLLQRLHKNQCILEERRAKFGSDEPIGLLNQIEDYEYAMELTKLAIRSEISKEEFLEEMQSLILDY